MEGRGSKGETWREVWDLKRRPDERELQMIFVTLSKKSILILDD